MENHWNSYHCFLGFRVLLGFRGFKLMEINVDFRLELPGRWKVVGEYHDLKSTCVLDLRRTSMRMEKVNQKCVPKWWDLMVMNPMGTSCK